ncbi:MAG: hypothetical protein R3F41_14775 [Gammaproteobacteria bacterium]|nr:hypothetical protein [Pseudomonadales bacterium]MCP5346903.1 hypothetical protein [Pseudomonadales bacterium]
MRLLWILTAALLTACNARMYIDQVPGDSGQALAPGQSTSFRFFTTDPSNHSGVNLTAGASYHLQLSMVSNWIDGSIDSDENGEPLGPFGFADSVMPLEAMALMKRSTDHRWFELMLYQDGCRSESLVGISNLTYDAESDSYLYVAPCSGDLRLFVNDSQVSYTDNVGFARITLSRAG